MGISVISALKPSSAQANSDRKGFRRALKLFQEAAVRVPAYRDFLKRNEVNPDTVRTAEDFARLPTTDKHNYITQYDMRDLSWDGAIAEAKYVSTSSGSTGTPYFWPRGHRQEMIVNQMNQRMYEDIFGSATGSTLTVDSFALGQWIAGFEFYNATKWTAERGSHIVTVTPGIDKTEAVREVQKLAKYFDRVVLAGYPPFVKDIIEHGSEEGLDWPSIDVKLMMGGEAVSEVWKDRILHMIGRPGEISRIVVQYGMAESGIVAMESPVSTTLRRSLHLCTDSEILPRAEEIIGMYQYYPSARYFESQNDGLVLTSDAGLPLLRYDTRDSGGIIDYVEAIESGGKSLRQTAEQYGVNLGSWQLPFVYLKGRKDFSVSLYALNIYVEHVKRALEVAKDTAQLSGLFTMGVGHNDNLDQRFEIRIELARGVSSSHDMESQLVRDIISMLCTLNTEYAKLYASIGEKARPHVSLVPYGSLQTIPGRKHSWFKRT